MCVFLFAGTRVPRGWVYEPVHHLALLHGHHVDTIRLHLSDTVWILMVDVAAEEVIHGSAMQTLSLRYGTVFMSKQQSLEVNNLFAELCDCS